MRIELEEFVGEVAAGLGDTRRIFRATQYVDALLQRSRGRKNFAQLARLATDEGEDRYRVEQAFQHLVNGSTWQPDMLLRPALEMILADLDVRAMMLLAVVFPRLGEHAPQYPNTARPGSPGGRRHQIASILQVVGVGRNGEPAILPVQWKLSLEGEERWYETVFRERAEVEYPIGVHVSVLGAEQVANVNAWGLTDGVPLVAGPSFERLRARWLQSVRCPPYLVEVPPTSVWVSQAELQTLLGTRPDAPRLAPLELDTTPAKAITAGTWTLYSLSGELGEERVLAYEPPGRSDRIEKAAWCTNLPVASRDEVIDVACLSQLRARTRGFWDEMRYGTLRAADYIGLSVKGWERHCALVSVAQAYRVHRGVVEEEEPEIPSGRRDPEEKWRAKVGCLWRQARAS